MAAETIQSTTLSNRDAKPQIPNPLYKGGRSFVKRETATTTTGKTSPSYYGFFELLSSCYVESVLLSNAALSTSVTMDIGLYETTYFQGSAGVFASVIAGGIANPNYNASALTNTSKIWGSAVAVSSAQTKQQQLLGNSSFVTVANMVASLWSQLGFTADPLRAFDLVLTSEATITAGGAIVMEVAYKMQ